MVHARTVVVSAFALGMLSALAAPIVPQTQELERRIVLGKLVTDGPYAVRDDALDARDVEAFDHDARDLDGIVEFDARDFDDTFENVARDYDLDEPVLERRSWFTKAFTWIKNQASSLLG